VSDGSQRKGRFLRLGNVVFLLVLYVTLFLVLHARTHHGTTLFHPLPVGRSALVSLVIVIIVAVYGRIRTSGSL
jgi:hypothetical protein